MINGNNSWSQYNTSFVRGRWGYVYNAISNSLIELDPTLLSLVYSADEPTIDVKAPGLSRILRDSMFWGTDKDNRKELSRQRQLRRSEKESTETAQLTICPTHACNFDCPYCFESGCRSNISMAEQTQDRLIKWIDQNIHSKALDIVWYGGEPLLRFDIIQRLTPMLRSLRPDGFKTSIVTNGYLMSPDISTELNDLDVSFVQITIDGPADIHNSRRMLSSGEGTFDTILNNIGHLLLSGYSGRCIIRVNIDRTNKDGYPELYFLLRSLFGNRIEIKPAAVTGTENVLNTTEWADFLLDLWYSYHILPEGSFYPKGFMEGICTASKRYDFVIGASGELYKCVDDVGNKNMVRGDIVDGKRTYDIIENDCYVCAGACRECSVLPICDYNGCPRKFAQAQEQNKELPCSLYRFRLVEFLTAYVSSVKNYAGDTAPANMFAIIG